MVVLSAPGRGVAACMPADEWHVLTRLGTRVEFRTDELLVRQGDHGLDVLVVLAGLAKVTRTDPQGHRAILALRGPGDAIGDLGALDQGPRSATVTALQPMAVRRLRPDDFQTFLTRPHAALAFARYAVMRLRESDDLRADIAAVPARVRLARLLHGLVTDDPAHTGIALRQQDLAELVGASRNTITTELSRLRAEGVVQTKWKYLRVLDVTTLARIAADDSDPWR
jgi:CRP/FNR family transcriptional regulator, cyclic AMP receptor protein